MNDGQISRIGRMRRLLAIALKVWSRGRRRPTGSTGWGLPSSPYVATAPAPLRDEYRAGFSLPYLPYLPSPGVPHSTSRACAWCRALHGAQAPDSARAD